MKCKKCKKAMRKVSGNMWRGTSWLQEHFECDFCGHKDMLETNLPSHRTDFASFSQPDG